MENKLTKAQVTTILQNAPKGSDPGKLIDGLVKRGYILEGFNEPKSTVDNVKDVAIGFGKGAARTALDVGQNLQTIGQGAMLATGLPKEMVARAGFQSLDVNSPTGQALEQKLAPTNDMQKYGGYGELGVEVLAGGGAGLIKDAVVGGSKLVAKGAKPVMELTKNGFGLAKEGISPTLSKERALGQVAQGEAGIESTVEKALNSVDTKGVKTYKDLNVKLEEAIPSLSQKVDSELLKDPTARAIKEYTTKLKTSSGDPVEVNYVQNAMKDLKELYDSTGDVVKSKEMENLLSYGDELQLDRKTVNDIARKYGEEFGTKAFSKVTGEPLTSVNAQKFENTRKGIKEVARQGLGGKEAKALDAKLSSLYDTQKLVAKQEEAVNKLKNKIEEKGWASKATYTAIKALDTVSGGFIRGATDAVLSRGQGLKTLNALDLERKLEKNLAIIRKASEAKTEAEAQKILNSLVPNAEENLNKTKDTTKQMFNTKGFIDPAFIVRDLKGKFAGAAEKFSSYDYKTMVRFLDYAHKAEVVDKDTAIKLEKAAQAFLNDQGIKNIPKTRAGLREAVQKIIDDSNFPTN